MPPPSTVYARPKYADAAVYLANPVINRAPKRSPSQTETVDAVGRTIDSGPRTRAEMLERLAASLPPEVAMTYALREYAVAIFTSSNQPQKRAAEPASEGQGVGA